MWIALAQALTERFPAKQPRNPLHTADILRHGLGCACGLKQHKTTTCEGDARRVI